MLIQSAIDKIFLNDSKYSVESKSTAMQSISCSSNSSLSSDEEDAMNHSMKNIQRKSVVTKPYSYFQKHRLHVKEVSTAQEYAYYDEVNIIHRDDMEDGYFLKENYLEDKRKTLFFGVFDGHHGKDVVQVIIKSFAPKFKKVYNENNNENILECFTKTFAIINKKIDKKVYKKDIGSTAFVGIIREEDDGTRKFYYSNCGDTTGYMFHNDSEKIDQIGQIHRLTNQDELKRVKDLGGEVLYERVGGILENSRSFGDFFQAKNGIIATPFTKQMDITNDLSYMIIGTDGLTDFITEKQLTNIMKKPNLNADKIADMCLSTCIVNKSNDNISIMVIKLN